MSGKRQRFATSLQRRALQGNIVKQHTTPQQVSKDIAYRETVNTQPAYSCMSQGQVRGAFLFGMEPDTIKLCLRTFRVGSQGDQLFANIQDGLTGQFTIAYSE